MIDPKLLFASENPDLLDHFSRVAEEFRAYFAGLRAEPVNPRPSPESVAARLDFDFLAPVGLSETIRRFHADLGASLLHVDHPMYFGVFNPNPLFAGVVAEILVAQFNPQLASTASAGYAIECETKLLRWFAAKVGWTDSSGTFCGGGTEANLTAVLCALHRRFPVYFKEGLAGSKVRPAIYVSVETHHSFKKVARILGLGESAVRTIPVDDHLRMSPASLAARIAEDRAHGFLPVLVVGTLGTTSAGTIDSFDALAEVCRAEGIDFHIDAAWGGGALLLPELRDELRGIELADSMTIDAHKWFAVPMTAGIFISRDPARMKSVFDIGRSPYMPPDAFANDRHEPFKESLAWSRRFAGLKLLFTLRTIGEAGYADLFRHTRVLCAKFRARLEGDPNWKIESDSSLPALCFRPARLRSAAEIEAFAEAVNETGQAWITTTRLGNEHRPALRVGFPNFATTEADVARLADILEDRRRAFPGA